MKCRAVVVIDYLIEGGSFRAAADEQDKLEAAIADIVKDNPNVVYHQVDMKERRGDQSPDISKMKFRTN